MIHLFRLTMDYGHEDKQIIACYMAVNETIIAPLFEKQKTRVLSSLSSTADSGHNFEVH
jgi:hypothetical protein